MLTPEEVAQIRAALTWGDQFTAAKQTENTNERAALAMFRAAKRIGLTDAAKVEDFLDTIAVADLAVVNDRGPTSAAIES